MKRIRTDNNETKFTWTSNKTEDAKVPETLTLKCVRVDPVSFQKQYAQLFNKKDLSDVTIKVGERQFYANKSILAAWSEFFRGMFEFNNRTKESKRKREDTEADEGERSEIELHGIDTATFETLLRFIYTGEIWLNQENVWDTLSMSDMYDVKLLRQECIKFLGDHITVQNCIEVYEFAEERQIASLTKLAVDYLCQHLESITQISDVFLNIPLQLLKMVLAEDRLRLSNEHVAFNAITKWIKGQDEKSASESSTTSTTSTHKTTTTTTTSSTSTSSTSTSSTLSNLASLSQNIDTSPLATTPRTKQYLNELIELVRFPLIETHHLERMEQNADLMKIPKMSSLLIEAWKYKATRSTSSSPRCKPRKGNIFEYCSGESQSQNPFEFNAHNLFTIGSSPPISTSSRHRRLANKRQRGSSYSQNLNFPQNSADSIFSTFANRFSSLSGSSINNNNNNNNNNTIHNINNNSTFGITPDISALFEDDDDDLI